MYGNTPYSAKWLKYLFDTALFEPLTKIVRDILRNNRIPALFIKSDTLVEAMKEKTTFIKVSKELFSDVILLF